MKRLMLWRLAMHAARRRAPEGVTYRIWVEPATGRAGLAMRAGDVFHEVPLAAVPRRYLHATLTDLAAGLPATAEADHREGTPPAGLLPRMLDVSAMGRDS